MTSGSAGYDLYAAFSVMIPPGERKLINTGIMLKIPKDYYGQIRERSSLAVKGIDVSAGVIDSDYRGEVKILLCNNSREVQNIECGTRVAQIIFMKHEFFVMDEAFLDFEENEELPHPHQRTRMGGFGSTGTH